MNALAGIKSAGMGLEVEFEVLPLIDTGKIESDRQRRILQGIAAADEQLAEVEDKIAFLNADIDRLTSHADGLDYVSAVVCGAVTGILDAAFVGEWDFAGAKSDTYKKINDNVISFAKKQPDYQLYCSCTLEGKGGPRRSPKDPNRLGTAIEYLEWKFHLPGDGAYSGGKYGIDGNTHRLDDLCHHPTLVGLVACVLVQFGGSTLYVNKYGEAINLEVTVNEYGNFVGKSPAAKLFAGVLNWFLTCAGTLKNRRGHLMSDVATSAGLPGSFLSLIEELASLPCFRNESFLLDLRNAFVNGIGKGKNQIDFGPFNAIFEGAQSKWDISTEQAAVHELRRQALPVILNEILVRGVYFIRRLVWELKEKNDVKAVEWGKVLPFNNRTIVRMMTVAAGTFTAVDMADAAAHAATRSVDGTTFLSNMLLRVNFIGVGRCALAVAADAGMGISRAVKREQRIRLQEQEIFLLDAKVYYKQAQMWIAAEEAGTALEEAYAMVEETARAYAQTAAEVKQSMERIGELLPEVTAKNPGLDEELLDILAWG